MAAAPSRWTDDRLDDHADRLGRFEANVDHRFDKVDERFDRVDERFDRFEADVDHRFDKVDERFDRADVVGAARFAAVHAEIATLSAKMERMNRTLIGGLVTILAAVVGKALFG
jgi:hypothetical protein